MDFKIVVSEKDEVAVENANRYRNNYLIIRLGNNLEIEINEEDAKLLYEGIEQALWDEDEHAERLRERVDDLEYQVNKLEEELEDANAIIENYRLGA